MICKRKLTIVSSIIFTFLIITIAGTNAHGQSRKLSDRRAAEKKRVSHKRLKVSMDEVERLTKRGNLRRATEEAKRAVDIAKKEFGDRNLIVAQPMFPLVDLLGKQKLFEEVEIWIEKIYALTQSRGEAMVGYAVGYRLRIARLYMQWNHYEKAESTLLETQTLIKIYQIRSPKDSKQTLTTRRFDGYTKAIDVELKKIYKYREANAFRSKKR